MPIVKGCLNATLSLTKSSCYYLRTGRCSLHMVSGFFTAANPKAGPAELLYCPRLYASMRGQQQAKAGEKQSRRQFISVVPHACGHLEVSAGFQRACIAAQKQLPVSIRLAQSPAGHADKSSCSFCGEQLRFERRRDRHTRIITLRATEIWESEKKAETT